MGTTAYDSAEPVREGAHVYVHSRKDGKEGKVAFVRGKWCGDSATEEILKSMRITIRCVPFDQSGTTGKCLLTGKDATMDVIYARTY